MMEERDAELAHERHEKETVADAAKAHAEWARKERAALSAELARLREALQEIVDECVLGVASCDVSHIRALADAALSPSTEGREDT
jgi:hypothetical protein